MENFFIDDKFHMDLDSLITDLDLDDDGAIEALPEDWSIIAEETELQKIFTLTKEFVVDSIMDATDKWEERFPEDVEDLYEKIKKSIGEGIDLDKMNASTPELYYPNGNTFEITKADLLEYVS